MKIEFKPRAAGTHRYEVAVSWKQWALPFYVAVVTSYYPTERATFKDFGNSDTWLTQHILVVRVLCMHMRMVLSGPLLEDDE